MSIMGWTLIVLVMLSFIFTWLLLLPALATEMYSLFKSMILWCRGIAQNEESKKNTRQVLEKTKPSNILPKIENKTEDNPKKEEETKEDIEKVQNGSNRSRGETINTIHEVTFRPTNSQ